MDLILWRHAEAVDGTPDHARELTPRGIKQAVKVADFLRPHLPDDCRILASASAQAVLHTARWPDAGGTVLVVGHQPALGEVAAQLLGCDGYPLSVKKGALWWFNRREREGSAHITLRLVITPDFL